MYTLHYKPVFNHFGSGCSVSFYPSLYWVSKQNLSYSLALHCTVCLYSSGAQIISHLCSVYLRYVVTIPAVVLSVLPICIRQYNLLPCLIGILYLYSAWAQTVPSVALSVLTICIQPEPRQSHLFPCLFCLSVFSLRRDSPICCPAFLPICIQTEPRQFHLLPCLFCLSVSSLSPDSPICVHVCSSYVYSA
jgi:hypothetical protein